MGCYHTLDVVATVKPEYLEFYEKDYLCYFLPEIYDLNETDSEAWYRDLEALPKRYRDLVQIWIDLKIKNYFQKYRLNDSKLSIQIEKKVIRHEGDLWEDLETFIKEILVPTTTTIEYCKIRSDDYGCREKEYTDLELRGGRLDLHTLVKSVEHIMIDGNITESHIIYKRGIPEIQQRDLDRFFQLDS